MAISSNSAAVAYVGPSLPGGVLPRFTIFSGGLPAHIAALAARSPSLRGLLVPVADLARARERVCRKGDLLNLYAARVVLELRNANQ